MRRERQNTEADLDSRRHFAERLRLGLRLASKNQSDLARELGYSAAAITYIAQGTTDPNLTTVVRIAAFLGVSIGWLCDLNHPVTEPKALKPPKAKKPAPATP